MLVTLLSWLLLYKYALLFGVIFFAAVALPLPSTSLMLAAGAFSGQGYLVFPVAFATAMVANVSGDLLGYGLARRFTEPVMRLLQAHDSPRRHELEDALRRYPGLAIFSSRFAGTADPLLNVLAGFARVPAVSFLGYSVLGNLFAIGGTMYLGYVVGANWMAFADLLGTAGWIVVACIMAAVIVITFDHYLGFRRSARALWHKIRSYVSLPARDS